MEIDLFANKLQHAQARAVADAVLGELDDAGVAAGAVLVSRADLVEQLLHERLLVDLLGLGAALDGEDQLAVSGITNCRPATVVTAG